MTTILKKQTSLTFKCLIYLRVVKDNVRSPNIRTWNIYNVSSIVIGCIPLQLRVKPTLKIQFDVIIMR